MHGHQFFSLPFTGFSPVSSSVPKMVSDQESRVVIVGAGFAGLTAAIECKLRGMQVDSASSNQTHVNEDIRHPILVDTYPGPSSHGDLLDFTQNAGQIFKSWSGGKVGKRIFESGVNAAKKMDFYNQDNELLRVDAWPHGDQVFAGHRGTMHRIIYEYAVEIGVKMEGGKRVHTISRLGREMRWLW